MGERAGAIRAALAAPGWSFDLEALLARLRVVRARIRAFDRRRLIDALRAFVAPIEIDAGAALLAAPLAMALGAAFYLGLEIEPAAWPGALLAIAGAAAAVVTRVRGSSISIMRAAALAAFCAAGFWAADLRVDSRKAPRVAAGGHAYDVEGWVEGIDASTDSRRRYVIRVARLDGSSLDAPRRVRVGAPAYAARLGEAVRVRAVLDPPQGPPTPGAYDFSRAAYFEQLGGVGYAVGRIEAAPDLVLTGRVAFGRRVTTLRGWLSERLRAAGGEGAGGVLAALVTGDRSEIAPATTDALYVSGLGHILSISGMHLALIGGGAFFALAFGLAAIDPLARRMNVRKLAAAGALAVSLAYLIISGGEAPTVRSFIMASVAFTAILADRRALTQRGVAIAALIILVVAPESAASPGFQMSFAAVVALIAANDIARARRLRRGERSEPREPGAVGAARRFLIGLSLTSLVAGCATAPFAAYHFNRVSLVGFIANLIAMPVFSAVAMPAAAIAGALAPLGLEGVPAWISARAIEIVIFVGETAAAHPAAQSGAAAAPPIALALAACALVAGAIVTRGRWRLAGALAFAAALAWRAPAGDLWIGESGGWLARVDSPRGVEWVGDIGRGDDYGASLYARRGGAEELDLTAPAASPAFMCDRAGCVANIDGKVIVVADAWSSVIEDCARADVVLTPGRAPARIVARCSQTQLIPRRGRGDRGAVVDLKPEEPRLLIAGGQTRPWRPAAGR